MILRQTFKDAINGYWDGGAKNVFDWSTDGVTKHDAQGEFIKIGSFDANHWFNVAHGKTERLTLSHAKRRLKSIAKKRNMECTFEYIE